MMKKLFVLVTSLATVLGWAQQDTLSRSVTVEREFQPVIQSAGKQNTALERLAIKEPQAQIHYSDYSTSDSSVYNAKPIRFPSRPFPKKDKTDGLLEGGLGYFNSALNFRYRVPVNGKASKGVKLNLFAKHDANWGIKTWEESKVGLDFVKQWSDIEAYFDVIGANIFYTRYGRYYNGDNSLSITHWKDLNVSDKQTIWTAAMNVGVRSRKDAEIAYRLQTGYQAYILPNQVAEHQIRTEANVEWNGIEHHAGVDLQVRNMLFSVEDGLWQSNDTQHNVQSRHAVRLAPYYRYEGERLRARVGINLDLNIGKGQQFSANQQVSFAPSPDVEVEYRIIPSWLAVYGGAEGKFGYGTLREYIEGCPYRYVARGVTSQHVSGYVPVDAFVGFKIRAQKNLLIDVYARYAYQKNQTVFYTDTLSTCSPNGYVHYFYSDYQRWKVGVELTYHYQDIIHVLASGNYYHWTPENVDAIHHGFDASMVYNRPSWDAHLRIDARIDQHWSLYSDNIFEGQTNALHNEQLVRTKAKIELNMGARYDFSTNLGIYLQMNNLLNRHHDIYYTYQSRGIQGQVGVSWKF